MTNARQLLPKKQPYYHDNQCLESPERMTDEEFDRMLTLAIKAIYGETQPKDATKTPYLIKNDKKK